VRWATLPSGARTPLDADPVAVVPYKELAGLEVSSTWRREPVLYRSATVVQLVRGREVKGTEVQTFAGVVVPDGQLVGSPRVRGWRSHFATCPQADEWRPQRGRKEDT
jgi:hypothetical protein